LGIAEVGHLKAISSNIVQKLMEVHQWIYFHQPPFWQYLVSGSLFSRPNLLVY